MSAFNWFSSYNCWIVDFPIIGEMLPIKQSTYRSRKIEGLFKKLKLVRYRFWKQRLHMCEVARDESLDLSSEKHWSHDHPLVFTQHNQNNGKEEADRCSMCKEPIQGSTYCCTHPGCKFYLHKKCASLSPEINHPFFHRHPLKLQARPPSILGYYYCDICYDRCEFFYNCVSCDFAVDVKCSLLLQFIAGNYTKVEHVCHKHPLISATKRKRSVKIFPCAACQESAPGPIYSCADCEFYIHKKCCELPTQITHPSHRKHRLLLLTDAPPHPNHCTCHLRKNHIKGFIYHCSLCEFDLKIKHVLSSEVEIIGNHEHPFTSVSRPMSFICDACATGEDRLPYTCNQCNLTVHKDCIWLPKVVKICRHTHPISRIYFLSKSECDIWDCRICYSEVNTEYGSYYCSDCKYIVHVNCAINTSWLQKEIQGQNYNETFRLLPDDPATSAQMITATEINHFSHQHNLKIGEEIKSGAFCDGCVQPISSHPFYCCKQCDFFLHQSCAILQMKMRYWLWGFEITHTPYGIFICSICGFYCSGFSYYKQFRSKYACLRCLALSDNLVHQGHEHFLFFDLKYEKNCSACGNKAFWGYKCKYCNFCMCFGCISLPKSIQHKNHLHPLALTYNDGDDASQHYCDICEEERDPSCWFYSYPNCDFTAHLKCTLDKYPFIKQGMKFKHESHPHKLASVLKVYYYPLCEECGEPCLDLAAECEEPECNYICHWKCLQFPDFFPIID